MLDFDLLIFLALGALALIVSIRVLSRKRRYMEDDGTDEEWRSSLPEMEWGDPDNPEKPDEEEAWRG